MHEENLSQHPVAWWLMRQFLIICFWAVVLTPVAVAAWIVVTNAADVEGTNRQRLAEAPRIAATMGAISRLKPRPRECDIDAQAVASCEVFTKHGERRVLQVSGGQ